MCTTAIRWLVTDHICIFVLQVMIEDLHSSTLADRDLDGDVHSRHVDPDNRDIDNDSERESIQAYMHISRIAPWSGPGVCLCLRLMSKDG